MTWTRTEVRAAAVGLVAFAMIACGGGDKAGGNASGAAAPAAGAATGAAPAAAAPSGGEPPALAPGLRSTGLLKAGTVIHTQLMESVSSLEAKPGDVVEATVIDSVFDAGGQLAIWGGARVDLRVATLTALGGNPPRGRVEIQPVALRFGSSVVPITGTIDSIPYLARGSNIIVERATALTVRLSKQVRLHP